jgi:hypothetical protein
VAWGCTSPSADVWEESEGADVREGVGKGEDILSDRYWCGILLLSMMLMVVELVDVEDDLVWSLGRNRRNDEMAIIEEGENDFMVVYSNRLCDPDQGPLVKCIQEQKVPFSHE